MMSGGPTLQQVTIGGGSGQQGALGGAVAPQQQGQPGRRAAQLGQYSTSVLYIHFNVTLRLLCGLPVHL